MPQTCATCFFYRDAACHFNAPQLVTNGAKTTALWPPVDPDDWCGDGIDLTGVNHFSPIRPTYVGNNARSPIHVTSPAR